jgi:hypothetical protein
VRRRRVKTLTVCLMVWVFIVPCAVAIGLILAFVVTLAPNPYIVCACLAFATLAFVWGPLWIRNSST